jgi:hypothetical protein
MSTDDEQLRAFEAALHAEGWSERVTVARELANWQRLATELGSYRLEIEDYTNDLYSREVLERLPEPLRARFAADVAAADERFRAASEPDAGGRLGRWFRVDDKQGWWWHRIPRSGPLAELLRSG